VRRISIELSKRLENSDASAHFEAGSALSEFIAGRLGAPDYWSNENHRKSSFRHIPDQARSIQRWENKGAKTTATTAPMKQSTTGLPRFYSTRPLLTQLL